MFWEYPLTIQKYETSTDTWSNYIFSSAEEHLTYIENQFLVPGKYFLRNTKKWKETGNNYARTVTRPNFEGGRYHSFTPNSTQHKKWKDVEKDRMVNGVIYDGWYIPPFYYFYLNFCPIYNDLHKKKEFAHVWDSDLWYMQYVMQCILVGKHVGGVKGRQKGYSYKHMAILYWSYMWQENSFNTIGAYDEKLVKKSWRYLEGYRNHINSNTTWRRGPTIPKSLEWNEYQMDEMNVPQGNHSVLRGVTFKQNPENDVGSAQTFFNYEEPGVSPSILETLEFIRPAVEKGSVTTGIIIACGSVGDLEDAEGIKTIFYNPDDYNFLGMDNIWDKESGFKRCCIFVSEAYNMIGTDKEGLVDKGRAFMDADGNSDVEFALAWIAKKAEQLKKSNKRAELKQLALSQKCISPEQAFKQRALSEFPVHELRAQQERILIKEKENLFQFKPLKGLLEDKNGTVVLNTTNPPPEHRYPIKPEWEDKRGVWTMYEQPDENPELFTYFACVDSIEVDMTDTSDSVASIDIFKAPILVTYQDKDGKVQTRVEGDKLVANYRGRFDSSDKTNEQMWLGVKLYNAWTYAERNKPNFINYMRRIGKAERYLAKESDVPLFKDLNIKNGNYNNNSKFGFHKGDNTEIWKYLKNTAKEYFATEYGRTDAGKRITGIDKIDDYWLLEEFCQFVEGDKKNYDRLVSFMGALFISKVYEQNRFIKKRSEIKVEKQEVVHIKRPVNLLGGYVPPVRKGGKPISLL